MFEAATLDRSAAGMAFVCECMRLGISEDLIASCFMHWKIGDHIRDQHDAGSRAITQAREYVSDPRLFEMNQRASTIPTKLLRLTGDEALFAQKGVRGAGTIPTSIRLGH
jgi:hypothetical protein